MIFFRQIVDCDTQSRLIDVIMIVHLFVYPFWGIEAVGRGSNCPTAF